MIDRIEREVEATFGQNGLSAEEATQTRAVLGKVFDQLEASTEDERKLLTAQTDKLEAERLKLVQAHYADAIPLDLMKTEQARITANLDGIKRRLVGLSSTYKEAREGLDQLADLITDLGDLYRKCEPSARQILVRAVVKKIVIDEDENISYEQTKAVSTAKTYAAQQNDVGSVTTKDSVIAETGVHLGEVSNFSHRVDLRGFEPLTPCMPCRCATNCATDPWKSEEFSPDNPSTLHHSSLAIANSGQPRAWPRRRPSGSPSRAARARRTHALPGETRAR